MQSIHLESGEVESGRLDLVPKVAEGEKICALFADWLSGQPAQFRAPLPFLKRGNFELEWTAASGGVAYASFLAEGEPLSLSVLLSGVDQEADTGTLEGFLRLLPEGLYRPSADRPLMAALLFPGSPESVPTLQLLNSALASVFFRTVLALHSSGGK